MTPKPQTSILKAVDYVAREWHKMSARKMLLEAAPRLRELPHEDGFESLEVGPKRVVRGHAYAFLTWRALDLEEARAVRGAEGAVRAISNRLDAAARELGREIDLHLRGEGIARDYEHAFRAAGPDGIGIAAEGIVQADPGDVFLYLGDLPILGQDDGIATRHATTDSIVVVLKVYGNAVPWTAPTAPK